MVEETEMRTSSGEPHPAAGVADMIDFAHAQEYNKATEIFNDLIGQKMSAALDQEKVAVAAEIFNDVEPEELDAEEADDETEEADTDDTVEDDADTEADEQ
tara:strand:+ start:165 stop:467 length:303 start_codon:yes stop_codon:yes gene_type:complete